jgi:hypothetical protein
VNGLSGAMSKQIEFGEIDFEAIEYRNEYRYTKAVFAFFAALALMYLPFPSSFEESGLWLLLGAAYLGLFAPMIAALFIQYRSRVIITGHGLLLKRPLLKDVEISYSEIGEVQVNGMVIRESNDSGSDAINLSEAWRKWAGDRINSLNIASHDGKRKISIEQSLENFDGFCDDLTERWLLAIDRYQGYAKGTSARQHERSLKIHETLKMQREWALLKAVSGIHLDRR